jgi:hypothetical protein
MVEGLRLRSQLQVATHDLRAVHVKMTTVVKKLVISQKGIISVRSAVTKKKEELMALKLEELRLMEAQNSGGREGGEADHLGGHPRAADRSPAGGHHIPEWGCEGQVGDPNGREVGHAAG